MVLTDFYDTCHEAVALLIDFTGREMKRPLYPLCTRPVEQPGRG